ncbi:hypothetical protein T07_9329 [Trichinella nelsoni]|uniref:Uncharacterized protein n=1 Tax=Trichinella nelsoni TaxID=6336 RepID=A0A0V0RUG3_9BILA|nr:hypothetical protein T07_9329 [Trichinella nelsoni]
MHSTDCSEVLKSTLIGRKTAYYVATSHGAHSAHLACVCYFESGGQGSVASCACGPARSIQFRTAVNFRYGKRCQRLSTTGDSVGVHSHGQVSEFKAAAAFLQKAKINAKDTRLSHLRRRRYCASGGVQATPDLIVLASSGTCCSVDHQCDVEDDSERVIFLEGQGTFCRLHSNCTKVTGDGDASRYLYSRGLIVFSRRLTARQRHKSTSAPIYWTLVLHCIAWSTPIQPVAPCKAVTAVCGRPFPLQLSVLLNHRGGDDWSGVELSGGLNDLRLGIDHFDSVNIGDRWSGDPAGKSANPGGGGGGVQHSQRNGQLTEMMTRMNSKVQEIAHKRALLFNKVDEGHCLKGNCPSCDKTSLLSQCGQTGGQLAGKSRLWEQRNADFKTAPAPSGRTLMTLTCDVALAKAYLCIPAVIRKKL